MTRLLNSNPVECTKNKTYGYKSLSFHGEKLGVYPIVGADHGAGKSRYLIRTLICNSKTRRINNNNTDFWHTYY